MHIQIDFVALDVHHIPFVAAGKLNRVAVAHLVNKSRSEVPNRRCTAFSIML